VGTPPPAIVFRQRGPAPGEGNPPWTGSEPERDLLNHPRLAELLDGDDHCQRSKVAAPRLAARAPQEAHPDIQIEFTSRAGAFW
jgi:hypothetical protein